MNLGSFLCVIAACGVNFALAADTYKIDPPHASVMFRVNHMGFSNVYGMFTDVSGKFEIDEKKPEKSSIEISIQTASVETHNAKRDEHLRKPDFFDAKQFPTIDFKSESIKKRGQKYHVKGMLTMHGVTKPLEFDLTRFRTGLDPMHKQRTGGEAQFHINRKDYGMNFMSGPNMVGDVIDIWVSVEGEKS